MPAVAAERKEPTILPRSVVVIIVLVLTAILAADVLGQFIPGSAHEASPVLDSALIGLLGMVLAGSKGPKPEEPEEQSKATEKQP